MSSTLRPLIDELVTVMRRGDGAGFHRGFARIWSDTQRCSPDELTAVIEDLAPWLPGLGGLYAKLAVLAGACVERGGSALPLLDVLPPRAAEAMECYALVPEIWARAARGRALPGHDDLSATKTMVRVCRRAGIPKDVAPRVAMSWFDTADWLQAMITVMARREFRVAMRDRDRVREAAAAIADRLEPAHWVFGLSVVLDDEPLVVLNPRSKSGFRLTMGGIGDNFQLHTLLADRLRDHLTTDSPEPAWVAAAGDGPPEVPPTTPIVRRFRLFDGHGAYVLPEGRPADIASIGGTRILVLHPPLGRFAWSAGRSYEHMTPTLIVDRVLGPEEAAAWMSRVVPARQTDFMAINEPPS
ncbi:hypothetical protein AB0L00_11615 [Actinoallomurus sp. NPDC052308]|uniref:hypothetical protein n=1 Tax=Actinoallomurus sp. NPDC052308 TaxID=3155530 RepID=UPI00343FB041